LSITEFNLIEKYFYQKKEQRKDVALGIGDDCALLNVPSGQQLAVTVDTLVENVHFLPSISAQDLAWKAITVNLSDLAAMGAEPAWLTLALTLPEANEIWLEAFSSSFFECVDYYGIQLVGGDTTSGPLAITIQAMGFTPLDSALKRSNAKPGDIICVTGNLGDAGLGLAISLGKHTASSSENKKTLIERFNRPTPRVAEGIALRNLASAAIDLSDGLAGDLLHILKESSVGAVIELDFLPLSDALLTECGKQQAIQFALSAGDDYELCFTIAEQYLEKLKNAFKSTSCNFTQIGRIVGGNELTYCSAGKEVELELSGYKHFHDLSKNH
jgi:thiamine-monophosphate kinase